MIRNVGQTKPPHSKVCHPSELQIFLLFSRSLSSWMTGTCWGAAEDQCDEESPELEGLDPGRIKTKNKTAEKELQQQKP